MRPRAMVLGGALASDHRRCMSIVNCNFVYVGLLERDLCYLARMSIEFRLFRVK